MLVGHPKLKNDLRRPKMEEIGDRTTVFEFGGLRDRQRDYIDWVLKASLDESVAPDDVITDEAATLLAAKLKTPLQIGQHLVRAFEAGFEIGAKPIDAERRRGGPLATDRRSRAAADAQRLRCPQSGRAIRCEARRNPPAAAWRPGPGALTGTHGRNARRRAADLISIASCVGGHLLRVRLTERALCLSYCASDGPLPSQIMCARKAHLLRVGPFIIARHYN